MNRRAILFFALCISWGACRPRAQSHAPALNSPAQTQSSSPSLIAQPQINERIATYKPSRCVSPVASIGTGVWLICQERHCNGRSLAETAYIRASQQPSAVSPPHQRLAGARAWLLLGLTELAAQRLPTATACLRSGIHEMGNAYHSLPSKDVPAALDLQSYDAPELRKITHSGMPLTNNETRTLATLLTYRIKRYISNHLNELKEDWYYIIEPCDFGDCDILLSISERPGAITHTGELPLEPWPTASPFLSMDQQRIRSEEESSRLLARYRRSQSFSEFLESFRNDGYIVKKWDLIYR